MNNDLSDKVQKKKDVNWSKWIRWTGTIVFAGLIFFQFDAKEVLAAIGQMNLGFYLLLFLCGLLNRALACFRWKLSLKTQDIDLSFGKLFPIFLYGQAMNLVMPSSIGGDSYRIFQIIQEQPDKKATIATATIIDRVLGIIALVTILLATTIFNSTIPEQNRIFLLILLGVGFVILFLSMFLVFTNRTDFIRKILYFEKLKKFFDKVVMALNNFRIHGRLTMGIFGVSLLFQALTVLIQAFIFFAVGVRDLPLIFYYYAIPVTNLILVLPISIGGIGLKEFSLSSLMSPMGVSTTSILSYSLIGYSFQILIAIIVMIYGALQDVKLDAKKESKKE